MTQTPIPRPNLAWNKPWSLSDLHNLYPLIASPKINGERALIVNGQVLSRTGKPIRNRFVQRILGQPQYEGLDGELTVGPPTDPMVRRRTRSGIGTLEGEPDFQFHIFDSWQRQNSFWDWQCQRRLQLYPGQTHTTTYLTLVLQYEISSERALLALEESVVADGWEGLILRSPGQPYKNGRSTFREFQAGRGMLKMKRFQDSEAVVLAVLPRRVNLNPQTRSPLGYAERSSAQAGLQEIPQLGSLRVRDIYSGQEFNIGTGLGWTDHERTLLWQRRATLPGRLLTFRFFNEGTDGLPHQPIFHAWRSPDDLPSRSLQSGESQ